MENATKALLIAAGVLIAFMVLSLLLIGYNEISSYYNEKSESTRIEQLAEFNKKFENYNRKNIRGSDIISLMNRVIDYNNNEAYAEGKKYKRIEVTIDIGESNLNSFKYITNANEHKYDFSYTSILPGNGKITNISTSDSQLINLTSTINDIIARNSSLGITDTNIQKLSANISNIVLEKTVVENANKYVTQNKDEFAYDYKTVESRKTLLNNILKISSDEIESNLVIIQKIVCQYYEYTQFKRAYFDCIKMEHDVDTGRIHKIEIQVKTKNGQVVFN